MLSKLSVCKLHSIQTVHWILPYYLTGKMCLHYKYKAVNKPFNIQHLSSA